MSKMKPQEYQDWKELAEFFWNHLHKVQEECRAAQSDFARQIGYARAEDIPMLVKLCQEAAIKSDTLEEVINLDYEDIFEPDEEEEENEQG